MSGCNAASQAFYILEGDLKNSTLSQNQRDELLGQLKVLGRDAKNVRGLYDNNGINVLGQFAFGDYASSTLQDARRCLANALLLLPQTQQYLVELGFASKAAEALACDDDDDEFLLSRILFLLTYNKSTDIDDLINNHKLAQTIASHVNRHSRSPSNGQISGQITPIAALSETLKLMTNILITNPQLAAHFSCTTLDLFRLLGSIEVPNPPLQPPLTYVLNALANVDLPVVNQSKGKDELNDRNEKLDQAGTKLISIFAETMRVYTAAQLETQAIPLLTVLRQINEGGNESLRAKLKAQLLPSDSERDLPLGQSSTLPSRLLKLITSPGLLQLPEAISSLLFELSNKDASTFINNIGYGYAAGYLMTHQIPVPEDLQGVQAQRSQVPVNPITGQRLDQEPDIAPPEMTQAEKEREAERLFVAFERLRATGVVDVQNPVRQAMEEGRFEELGDSDTTD